jgi:hypothetical protein
MKLIITGLVFLFITFIIWTNNDYMTYKNERVMVIDKLTTTGGYKTSGHFYLILKTEQNQVFDLSVTPATFSQSQIGDMKTFNLRPFDIKQSPSENALYFFGQTILLAIGGGLAVTGIIFKWFI